MLSLDLVPLIQYQCESEAAQIARRMRESAACRPAAEHGAGVTRDLPRQGGSIDIPLLEVTGHGVQPQDVALAELAVIVSFLERQQEPGDPFAVGVSVAQEADTFTERLAGVHVCLHAAAVVSDEREADAVA